MLARLIRWDLTSLARDRALPCPGQLWPGQAWEKDPFSGQLMFTRRKLNNLPPSQRKSFPVSVYQMHENRKFPQKSFSVESYNWSHFLLTININCHLPDSPLSQELRVQPKFSVRTVATSPHITAIRRRLSPVREVAKLIPLLPHCLTLLSFPGYKHCFEAFHSATMQSINCI